MKNSKRLLSLILSIIIILGMIPAAMASSYDAYDEVGIPFLSSAVDISVTPNDATLQLHDADGSVISRSSGNIVLDDLIAGEEYTYTASKYGYVSQSSAFTFGEEENISITLEEAEENKDIDSTITAQWKNFRNSDANLGITTSQTPKSAAGTSLKWVKSLGSGYTNAPSVQIIADDSLIVMSGSLVYKLSLESGEILRSGTLVSTPSYGYIPPTYAEGMIFAPLGGGYVQALNADTLESLWVYKDPLGGQAQTPITYSDGYIYTGFWDKETTNANYVCLCVTDEDISSDQESKEAVWRMTSLGGFYWAGAVVVGNAVIFGSDNGEGTSSSGVNAVSSVYSLNKYTGEEISTLSVTGDQRSSIAYSSEKERIYFTTKAGYIYSAAIDAHSGELSGLIGEKIASQSTSTPIVYGDKVYFTTGSGISETGSTGNFVASDADTLEMLYAVGLKGYPQCSLLMSAAYEDTDGLLYFYSTYNNNPGGLSLITVDADKDSAEGAKLTEIYDAAGYENYCIASPICDTDGTVYYKNDSGHVLALSPTTAWLETLSSDTGEGLEGFSPNVTDYELKVPAATSSLILSLTTPENTNVEISLDTTPVSSEVSSGKITAALELTAGKPSNATITVTCGADERLYNISIRETTSDTSLKAVSSGSNNISSGTASLSQTGNIFILNNVKKNINDRLWFTPSDPNASISGWTVIEGANKSPASITSTNVYDGVTYKNRVYYSSFSGTTLASVKVTAENGEDSEVYYFIVSDSDASAYNYASELSLNKTDITLSQENLTETLIASVTKSIGTLDTPETLTWTSSDEGVATVTQSGVVTYAGEGSAVITVSGKLGASTSCSVKCKEGDGDKINVTIAAYDYNAVAAGLTGASDDGVIMERTIAVDKDTSAALAIAQAFDGSGVDIVITESQYGDYVSSVNGLLEGTGGGYSGWCLNYNNDDFTNYGLGSLTLKSNDRIELHYSVNPDGATDDIGNGWYGKPIITSFTLSGRTVEMSKTVSYDENYNAITTYYIHSQQGAKTKMRGDGSKENPLIIPITLPSGANLASLTASYSASLNEHYLISENLEGSLNYTNSLTFSISSRGGFFKTYYKVTPSVETSQSGGGSDEKDDITVSFRLIGSTKATSAIDLGSGGYNGAKYVTWIKTKNFTVKNGATVYDVFKKALDDEGLRVVGADNNYVKTIYAPDVLGGYALSEFTNGKRSGWMYSVNGKHPSLGLKSKILSDGDEVIWHYANDYSYEIKDWFGDSEYPSLGDGTYYNKWLGAADVRPSQSSIDSSSSSSASSGNPASVAPDTTMSSAGEVKVRLTSTEISEAVKSIKDKSSNYILIEPNITKVPTSIHVTMPKSAAEEIVSDTDASTIIKTAIGYIDISNDTLSSIVNQAKADTIEIIITAKDLDSVKDIIDTSAIEGAKALEVSIKSGDVFITDLNGQALLVSLPVESKFFKHGENYKVAAIKDEACENLIGKCVYLGGKLFVEAAAEYPAIFVAIPNALGFPFDDLDGHWALESARFAYQNDLMNGMSATKFAPEEKMTRAMLVTVLYRMENSPKADKKSSFTDLESGSWYEDAVIWAYEHDIVNGYSEDTFAPFDNITREQMASILMKYANYKNYKVIKFAKLDSYEDAKNISTWAHKSMEWTLAEGLITGRTDTELCPKGDASRGEVATILMRFMQNIAN